MRGLAARLKPVLCGVLAAGMVAIGLAHFTNVDAFAAIVPDALPAHRALVYVSGVAEIAGGLGLAWSRTRRAAAFGLVALYVAVFPANVNMAVNHLPLGGAPVPEAVLWLRLPFQLVFVAWAYWMTRPFAPKPP
ncbi:MAG TPA: hypothetical protein VHB21_09500 [Minicystis sp.]|nr:hypothetical protein [Minicystis sp.]